MSLRILISESEIGTRVRQLAAQIGQDYPGGELVLICVLKGSYIFAADLARAISREVRIEFVKLASYGNEQVSSGKIEETFPVSGSVAGAHVIIVEDIVDTGNTLAFLLERVQAGNPRSVQVAALLDKPSRRQVDVSVKYVGFEIPDKFVVGYGMDFQEAYRNLRDICVLNGAEEQ